MSIRLRALITLLVAAVVVAAPCWAKDDTIILRLEDENPAADASSGAAQQSTSSELSPVIDVPPSTFVRANPLTLKCGSAVLMDAGSGQVIFARNPHVRRPNASTTKVMTCILLIENCGMDDKIKASKHACGTPFTSLNLRPGECITARDLLAGMLVRSANDAAVAVAEHIAGSLPKFAKLMNRKAREIGCTNTHFVTPNGLYAKGHYSTAYDLCLMARYALRYPVFNEFAAMRKHLLLSRTINRKDLAVVSRNKFLRNYAGADGIKSGYLKQAGCCYVGSATRDGWRLISSVLMSENSAQDTAALMDYAFNNFAPYTVARANTPCTNFEVDGGAAPVQAAPERDLRVVVPKTGARITTSVEWVELEAPVTKGRKVGVLTASVNGVKAASVELRAFDGVGISLGQRLWHWTKICGVLMLCWVVRGKYVAATAKSARRRRRRVTAPLRSFDRYR